MFGSGFQSEDPGESRSMNIFESGSNEIDLKSSSRNLREKIAGEGVEEKKVSGISDFDNIDVHDMLEKGILSAVIQKKNSTPPSTVLEVRNIILKGSNTLFIISVLLEKYMLRISDPFRVRWDLFVMTLAIYNCVAIPFHLAFHPPVTIIIHSFIYKTYLDS